MSLRRCRPSGVQMLVGTPLSVVGSRFWHLDEVWDGLVAGGTVLDIKILIFVMRDRFTVVALLPLTQNTLPSKDVREYVFWCYLMPWRSRDLLGMILNEFGTNHLFHIFLILLIFLIYRFFILNIIKIFWLFLNNFLLSFYFFLYF